MDATERLAQRAIALSGTIINSLIAKSHTESSPLQYVLNRAKHESARALTELVNANPEDPGQVRSLQNEAELYSRLLAFIREAFQAGLEQDGQTFKAIPYEDAVELYYDVTSSEGDYEE
jgi:hypothetical protein